MNQTVEVSVNNVSRNDIIIAVMGPTGVGKSTFIDLATGLGGRTVGNTLESCTAHVQAVRTSHPTAGKPIVFVDTPGFDDSTMSDTEVLRMIAEWLEKTYKRQIKLAGIIYMHRISDNRMAGAPQKNLHVFANLCGDEAMHKVILATTMWNKVKEDTGARREMELKEEYWKAMLEKNSTAVRFYGTSQSAWNIVDEIIRSPNRSPLLLQEELVDFHKRLSETKAGITLYEELRNLVSLHNDAVRKLQEEARIQNNPLLVQELDAQSEAVQEQIRKTLDQIQEMRIPLGRRIRSLFMFKRLSK